MPTLTFSASHIVLLLIGLSNANADINQSGVYMDQIIQCWFLEITLWCNIFGTLYSRCHPFNAFDYEWKKIYSDQVIKDWLTKLLLSLIARYHVTAQYERGYLFDWQPAPIKYPTKNIQISPKTIGVGCSSKFDMI